MYIELYNDLWRIEVIWKHEVLAVNNKFHWSSLLTPHAACAYNALLLAGLPPCGVQSATAVEMFHWVEHPVTTSYQRFCGRGFRADAAQLAGNLLSPRTNLRIHSKASSPEILKDHCSTA